MRIIIITQNEPFYLVDNLIYLIKSLPVHSEIVGCVVNDASPFGKKETFFQKAIKTYKIFGFNFFIYYSFKYLINVFDKSKKVDTFLKEFHVPKIVLAKHINHK